MGEYLQWDPVPVEGRDLLENENSVPPEVLNNHYLPDLLVEKAEQIIYKTDVSKKPLFLYFATPLTRASTSGNGKNVQFTMPQYLARPSVELVNATWPERRKQLGLLTLIFASCTRTCSKLRTRFKFGTQCHIRMYRHCVLFSDCQVQCVTFLYVSRT